MTTTDDRIVITLALLPTEIDALRWALQEQRAYCTKIVENPKTPDDLMATFKLRVRQLTMLDQLVYAMSTQ